MGLRGEQIVVNNIYPWRRTGKWEMNLRLDQEIRSTVRQPVEGTALDQRGQVGKGQIPTYLEALSVYIGVHLF